MAALADQDWALRQEDLESSAQDGANPMHAFVHEHLLSILTPFAEHVRVLEQQVRALQDDFLEHRVTLGDCTAAQRAHEKVAQEIKEEMAQVSGKVTKSQNDVTKLIDIFSKANFERQEKLRSDVEEELGALRRKVDPLPDWCQVAEVQLAELAQKAQGAEKRLDLLKEKSSQLQESCDLNKFCFHGLSDRLEATKAVADVAHADVQRLKVVESCHHQDLSDALGRLQRRVDRTDAKAQHNLEDLKRTDDGLGDRLARAEKGLDKVTNAIESLDANMQATLLQYEEAEASEQGNLNALERLANHVHRIREELLELTHRLHGEVTSSVCELSGTVETHGEQLQHQDQQLQGLEDGSESLDAGLRKAHQLCAELNREVESVWQRAQKADDEIRSLILTQDNTGEQMEEVQQDLNQAKGRLRVAEHELEAHRSAKLTTRALAAS
ncbi:unnamed protein product [Effrenium voratum]|uniref:Uncharacterized protein n=1 Tax=Effrenium voratum TaxID=2562239 RepID=A0AA36J964_9DINO|nr:unnamed protein product [Effrenium voratum]